MTELEMEVVVTQIIKDLLLEKRFPFGIPQRGIGKKKATGNLINSIRATNVVITENMETISFDLNSMNYYINVDKGRFGNRTPPPIEPILKWVKTKGLRMRNAKGQFAKGNQLSLAFAISKKIGRRGIRPANIGKIAITAIENDPRFFDLYQKEAFDKLDKNIKLD